MDDKIYYTGVRKTYFYFFYLMASSYFDTPYKNYPRLSNNIASWAKGDLRHFAFLYNERAIKSYFDHYLKKPALLSKLFEDINDKKSILFKKYRRPFRVREYSAAKLKAIYHEFYSLLKILFYLNQVVWHLDIGGGMLLDKSLRKNFNYQDVNLLILPGRRNYLEEEENAFLKICLIYLKDKKAGQRLLLRQADKYSYIGISYADEKSKQLADYLKQINNLQSKGLRPKDIRKIILTKNCDFKANLKKRDRIFKQIRDKVIRKAILLLRQSVYGKDYFRDNVSQITHFYINPLIDECARRWQIDATKIKRLNYSEFNHLFNGKRINWGEINKRERENALTVINGKLFMVFGKKARDLKNRYFLAKVSRSQEINGVVASSGKIKGRVCICLTHDDFKKFKKGDILVATNTMPEFVPIMTKSSAIITDVGGLTSHAAIMSRELKKPCIIGTKIATKVLKDGDLVEADANKGVVKIIKHKK